MIPIINLETRLILIGYFLNKFIASYVFFNGSPCSKRKKMIHDSLFFLKLADGDPLESAYAIHICGNLPYGNDICITITSIFEKHVHVS